MSAQHSCSTMTLQTVEADLGEQAYHQSTTNHAYDSDRARNIALSERLISLYMKKFKMDARQAREAVDMEMADKYAPNPWDAPAPRKYQQRRQPRKDVKAEMMVSCQGSRSTVYSEEQWDLFEKLLK